ncbi:MAG: SWIM zinc finger family protein, partial [Acidimicrobiales bacterium]
MGASTLARGRGYAAAGAVTRREWEDPATLVGEVQGGALEPYQVRIRLSGGARPLDGTCSCPVGRNCKHAVALLFAAGPRPALQLVAAPGPPPPPAWEQSLLGLLATEPTEELPASIALQFELVEARTRPGRPPGAAGPGIRVRPVVRGASGRWVRGDISWSRLDYFGYGRAASTRLGHDVALLKELRALHALAGVHYGYQDDVWLESIPTRRVWDVLRQAEEAGIPLLRSGREGLPVRLSALPAEAAVDVTQDGPGLRVRPRMVVGPDEVPAGRRLLIGSPAHGVAWWHGKPDVKATPELHMAPLSQPLQANLADLMRHGPLQVPAADADRFRRDVAPVLRRRVVLQSSDGSVELPDVTPDELLLQLAAAEGPSVELAWSLGGPGREPRPVWDHPDEGAAAAAARATDALAGQVELLEDTPWGRRLAGRALLKGLEAVRFVTEMLPALEDVEGLRVEWLGEVPEFREVTEAPLVTIGGEESDGGDWFDLTVEVRVGGEAVPFQALFVALAQGESHLLLPSGTYFSLDRPELRQLAELIAEARSLHDAPRGRVRLGRFQASLWEELQQLGVVSAQAGAWADAVAVLASSGDDGERALPAGLTASLRPYQATGFQWL